MDDLLINANGGKFNPLALETRVVENHKDAVEFAIVVGNHRPRPVLVIQLRKDFAERESGGKGGETKNEAFRDALWQKTLVAENARNPIQGQIHPSLILFTTPEKPLPLAGKGTVRRGIVEEVFGKELDELYSSLQN